MSLFAALRTDPAISTLVGALGSVPSLCPTLNTPGNVGWPNVGEVGSGSIPPRVTVVPTVPPNWMRGAVPVLRKVVRSPILRTSHTATIVLSVAESIGPATVAVTEARVRPRREAYWFPRRGGVGLRLRLLRLLAGR